MRPAWLVLTLFFNFPAFVSLLAAQSGPSSGPPVFQGLTEVCRRLEALPLKPRDETFSRFMQRPDGSLQPELLIFRDSATGREVWRLTWDFSRNTPHCHINRSPWNSDGSLFALTTDRWLPGSGSRPLKRILLLDSDGGGMRILEPRYENRPYYDLVALARHVIWDRSDPGRMYFVDRNSFYLADLDSSGACVAQKVADLDPPGQRREIYSYVSDNNIVMVKDHEAKDYPVHLYFFDMRRDSPQYGRLIQSYGLQLGLEFPGHKPDEEWRLHDITFRRDPADHYILDYGPFDPSGEPIFWEFPLDGKRADVRLCYAAGGGSRPYFSHPAWAAGGALVAYYGDSGRDADNFGLHVWDYTTDRHLARLADSCQVDGGHIAWDGEDRVSFFASPSPRGHGSFGGKIIWAHLDGRPTEVLCTTYTQWQDTAGGKEHDYCSIARPAQSPDGTKCFFSSTMLQPEVGSYDCYVVVAKRPEPPVELSAVQEGRGLRLTWTPHELAHEIKLYRAYRIRGVNNSFLPLAECPAGQTELLDSDLDSGNVYYYAVTSQEYSGLESDRLSPVIEVQVEKDGRLVIRRTLETGTGWDNIPPQPPLDLRGSRVQPGSYQLEWKSSPSADMRFYNLYYADGRQPTAGPECLIASLPAGETAFFDYGARQNGQAHYMLIAVDRQDNLSDPVFWDEP